MCQKSLFSSLQLHSTSTEKGKKYRSTSLHLPIELQGGQPKTEHMCYPLCLMLMHKRLRGLLKSERLNNIYINVIDQLKTYATFNLFSIVSKADPHALNHRVLQRALHWLGELGCIARLLSPRCLKRLSIRRPGGLETIACFFFLPANLFGCGVAPCVIESHHVFAQAGHELVVTRTGFFSCCKAYTQKKEI